MVRLLLILQLFALGYPTPPPSPVAFQQHATAADDADDPSLLRDGPDPAPLTGHGAYEHARGWICDRRPTSDVNKHVECHCKMRCENNGMEDRSCMASCNSQRCRCHVDQSCDAPEVMPAPKPKKGKR